MLRYGPDVEDGGASNAPSFERMQAFVRQPPQPAPAAAEVGRPIDFARGRMPMPPMGLPPTLARGGGGSNGLPPTLARGGIDIGRLEAVRRRRRIMGGMSTGYGPSVGVVDR